MFLRWLCTASAFLTAAFIPLGFAGELTPPGAPESTMVTLDEIGAAQDPRTPITALPVTIEVSGSYYLTGSLTGTAGANGIAIAADGVTIDLCGFALIGVPGSGDGISVSGLWSDLTVMNGSIQGWGGDGLHLHQGGFMGDVDAADNGHLEGLLIRDNGSVGARLASNWTVLDCTAEGNALSGFAGMFGNVFVRCVSRGNQAGFSLSNRGGVISHCTVMDNTSLGISLGDTAVITESVIHSNDGDGIHSLNGDITVRDCLVSANDGTGILAGSDSSVEGCDVIENAGGGITVFSNCRVVGNNVSRNALVIGSERAGIAAAAADNRIEGNHLTDNNIGIRADDTLATGNFIVRNTVADSTGDDYMVDTGDNLLAPARTSFIGAGPWDNFSL